MTILDYYKAHLEHVFGEEKANRIIENSKIYSTNLESSSPIDEKSPSTEVDQNFSSTLKNNIFPIIGLYRAMLMEGFTEEEISSFLKSLWDIAPDEIKTPPLQ